MLRKIGKTVG